MLEQPGLLLCPWRWETPAPPGSHPALTRRVRDLQSQQVLGLVRQIPSQAWPLFRWLTRRTWQVLETEDESLLLTLYAPWGLFWPWEVRDADDRLVCSVYSGDIYDAAGSRRARAAAGPQLIQLLGKDKVELASITRGAQGLELRYAACLESDPYAKMAILGTALIMERGFL